MSRVLILAKKSLLNKRELKSLARDGIRVREASKYKEDLWYIKAGDYDIVVVDENVFGGDARLAARQIRGISRAIIILVGRTSSWEMWDHRRKIGIDHYCRKPMQAGDLAHRIKLARAETEYRQFREKMDTLEPGSSARLAAAAPPELAAPEAPAPASDATPLPAGETPVAPMPAPEAPAATGSANIWQEPQAARLVSELLSGPNGEIKPQIDLRLKDGFAYPQADDIMGTSGRATASVLERLADAGILVRENAEEVLASPSGSLQLTPVERCPHCDSDKLTRGQLLEHFNCGFIGPEEEFHKGLNLVCPKCQRELKLIGTDYRKPGMRYVCNSCHSAFPSPAVKCRDLKTGDVYAMEELRRVPLYRYHLNEAHRRHLEFELEPKRQLIDYLKRLGYDIKEAVPVKGRSGAMHTLDLVAGMDELITRHTVVIGILSAPREGEAVDIEALFSFDSKIYDTGIENKMVIAMPRLADDAMKFAERQGIRVYGLEELRALLRMPPAAFGKPTAAPAGLSPEDRLQWLLEKRGYSVHRDYHVTGRSGTEHTLKFYAQKDDGIVNHRLAAGIITGDEESDVNAVMRFDTAAYDASIRDKVVVTVPELSREARQFADYQRIKVIPAEELFEAPGRAAGANAALADQTNPVR